MDVAIILVAAFACSLSGVVFGYLQATRATWVDDMRARQELRAEIQSTLHTLAQEHNKLTMSVADSSDRTAAIEMRLATAGGRTGAR